MQFLRTMSLQRIADVLKLLINGTQVKSQSTLDIQTDRGISITQTEGQDTTNLLLSCGSNGTLGYYGSFWDSTTQTITSTSVAYVVTLNSTDGHDGISLVGGSKLTVANTAVYNLSFSAQLTNTDSQAHDATFWIRRNGTDVSQSASIVTVPSTHGGVNGHYIFYVDIIQQLVAGDYLEIAWCAGNTAVKLETIAAGVSPTRPLSPSVIVSMVQV